VAYILNEPVGYWWMWCAT